MVSGKSPEQAKRHRPREWSTGAAACGELLVLLAVLLGDLVELGLDLLLRKPGLLGECRDVRLGAQAGLVHVGGGGLDLGLGLLPVLLQGLLVLLAERHGPSFLWGPTVAPRYRPGARRSPGLVALAGDAGRGPHHDVLEVGHGQSLLPPFGNHGVELGGQAFAAGADAGVLVGMVDAAVRVVVEPAADLGGVHRVGYFEALAWAARSASVWLARPRAAAVVSADARDVSCGFAVPAFSRSWRAFSSSTSAFLTRSCSTLAASALASLALSTAMNSTGRSLSFSRFFFSSLSCLTTSASTSSTRLSSWPDIW